MLWRASMIGVVGFFIVTSITIVVHLSDLGNASKNVTFTHISLKLLADLLGAVKDVDRGQQGFLLTRDEKFLEPKNIGEAQMPKIIDQLKVLVAEDPAQLERIVNLADLLQRKQTETELVLQLAQYESLEIAQSRMKNGIGEALMDEIQVVFTAVERHEIAMLRERLADFETIRQRSRYIIGGTVLAMLLLTVATILLDADFRRSRAYFTRESAFRKIAEEALQHTQSRLRTALTNLPLRLYSTDLERRYTWIHDPQHLSGAENVLGKRDEEIFDFADVAELVALQEKVIQSGSLARATLRLPYTGKQVYYNVTIEPDRAASGAVTGVTVSAFDIQQQIDLQHALEQKARDFRTITDTMPQLVWTADGQGTPDYFNLRWHEYTAMAPDQKHASLPEEIIHPDDYSEAIEEWRNCLSTGEAFESECRLKNGNTGEYRWFVVRALPVRDQFDTIFRWLGTFTDVDDQKRVSNEREQFLEGERAARKQVEHVMAAKEAYIATLTHELRGPLNSILGWTQLLRTKEKVADVALVNRALDVIEQNARNQSQLVADLFDMQGINAGKVALTIETLDLSKLVNAAADSILPACAARNITLVKVIDSGVCNLQGEARRLNQVMMNLLNNSLKFTPQGGTITIALRSADGTATIEVRDSGIGIDQASLPHIFDRYNQGYAGASDRSKGLGLGLSIARSIVRLHGGKVEAFSEGEGKGSLFRLSLPCSSDNSCDATCDDQPSCPSSVNLLNGLRVLLVEDQDDAREALARILTGQGATVSAAHSGPAALELLDKAVPHMIISDISMSGMDGYMFIQEVKCRYSDIPSIALTAFTREEDKQRALAAGFNRHMGKPLDAALLIDVMRELVTAQSHT